MNIPIIGPRVYVPQEPTRWDHATGLPIPMYDFAPALRYGRLVVCLPPNISFHITKPVSMALREKMKDFNDDDYLIAVGSPLIIALSTHIALSINGGRLNFLTWDKREGEYLNTRIEL